MTMMGFFFSLRYKSANLTTLTYDLLIGHASPYLLDPLFLCMRVGVLLSAMHMAIALLSQSPSFSPISRARNMLYIN